MEKENIFSRFKKAINVFRNKDPTYSYSDLMYGGSAIDQSRLRPLTLGSIDRTIVSAIYARISVDAASMNVRHVRTDDNARFVENIDSRLDECLSSDANIDQTGRALIQDAVLTLLEHGCAVFMPSEIENRIIEGNSPDEIYAMRIGIVKEWYPRIVKIEAYNELTGRRDEIFLPKNKVAIVQNPFYTIMNTPNSTLQRLIRKLNLLDAIDNQNGSSKMDLIIQLPFPVKTELKEREAEKRLKSLEYQMSRSKYGIGYIDATEHITQLNRAVENNLLPQIEYLTKMVHAQLGITPEILSGTANEQEMKNYLERTISPIMTAITEELQRKFLSKTARTRRQAIMAFSDPFRMVPTSQIAEMADKLTRNEIMTSNEIRKLFGIKPSDDPAADELRNKNLNQNQSDAQTQPALGFTSSNGIADPDNESLLSREEYRQAMADLNNLDNQLYEMSKQLKSDELKHYASPYYDPVKAHEYYERTKKLKGRKSTSELNDEGKAIASYVKERLDTERNQNIKTETDRVNKEIATIKENQQRQISTEQAAAQRQIQSYSVNVQRRIDVIRSRMSRSDISEAHKAHLQSEITNIRGENAEQKAKIQLMYKTTANELKIGNSKEIASLREELSTSKTNIKSEYEEKYLSELDGIKADPSFLKTSATDTGRGGGYVKLSNEEVKERRLAIDERNAGKITDDEANKRLEAAKKKHRGT